MAFFATASAVRSGLSIKALAAASAYEPPDPMAAADTTCSVMTQAKFDHDAYKAVCASQTYDAIMWFKDITIPCYCQALLCICYYHDSLQDDHC